MARVVALRVRLDSLRDLATLTQRCRHLFDLDAAPAAIAEVLTGDPFLAPLVAERPGLRLPGAVDGFELAVRAILGQQVSIAGARTLTGRLVTALGEPVPQADGRITHYFPRPERLADAELGGLGLTQARITAIHGLARAVCDEGLVLDRGADWVATLAQLDGLSGIGPWTASYIAMRALGDPDALPAADLALRHAVERLGWPGDPRSIERRAEAWRPWRAYAAQHLWASLTASPMPRLPARPRAVALLTK